MKKQTNERNMVQYNLMKFNFAQICLSMNKCWKPKGIYPENWKVLGRDVMRIFEIVGYKYMAYGRPFKRERKEKKREAWKSLENLGKKKKIKGKPWKFMRDKPPKH
jgi:hypothetical protein